MIKKLILITLIGAGSMQAASSSTTTTTATPVATTTTTAATSTAPRTVRLTPGRPHYDRLSLLEQGAHQIALRVLDSAIFNQRDTNLLQKTKTPITFELLSKLMPTLPDELNITIINKLIVLLILSKTDIQARLQAVNDVVTEYAHLVPKDSKDNYEKILDLIVYFTANTNLLYKSNALNTINLMSCAIDAGYDDMLKYLLSLDLDTANIATYLMQMRHALNQNKDLAAQILVQHALKHRGNINRPQLIDEYLISAAANCNIPTLQRLFAEYKCNNFCDRNNDTLLALVFKSNKNLEVKTETALWLIEQGVNIENCHPLHLAACIGSIPVMEALVDKKVDINAQDIDGHCPLTLAIAKAQTEAAFWLIDRGAKVDRSFMIFLVTINTNCPTVAEKILTKNPNLERRDPIHGHTALTYSFCLGRFKISQLLLAHGADSQVITPPGNNILLLLVRNCADILKANTPQEEYLACLDLALQHITNLNHQNNDGNTALHLAYTTQQGRELVVPILLARGADTTIVNNAGLTPEQMPLRAQE